MTLEQDLHKLEGEIYPIEVRLNAADGAVDTNNYEVYGAAEAGRSRFTFSVETTEEPGVYIVTIPALSFLKNPYWDYQICARRRTTGHEWLLLQGHIKLRYRIADVPDIKVGATQQTFTATISADSLSVDVNEIAGVKGDRGYSAYEIACQNGFEGTEEDWLASLRGERGVDGLSAYTIACQNGFKGTEQEFTNMMICVQTYAEQAQKSSTDAYDAQILSEVAAINALQSAQDAKDAIKDAEVPDLTPEAIQAVAPIAWRGNGVPVIELDSATNCLLIGDNTTCRGEFSTALGSYAGCYNNGTAVGYFAKAKTSYATALGQNSQSGKASTAVGYKATCLYDANRSVTIGSQFEDTSGKFECTTEGTGSITIGAGANTKNPIKVDGTPVLDSEGKPKESSNSVTIGCKAANNAEDNVVIGAQATSNIHGGNVIIGAKAGNDGVGESNGASQCVVIGNEAKSSFSQVVAVGAKSHSGLNSVALGFLAKAKPNKTIAIGASSSITDTTAADGKVTKSENTIVIGHGATASAPDAVVMGAGASVEKTGGVAIGCSSARCKGEKGVALGFYAGATGNYTTAIGASTLANRTGATAIGYLANANDIGVVVFASNSEDFNTRTKLYFSGANTPLANEYYNGEAMMGYTVTDKDGNKLACGTRRLSELFPDNTLTQPASLDENGEWVMPKVFHPSDLDLPVEEPTEPEDVEINTPEPEVEEYQPLPVYPIVEPEIEEENI